MMACLRERQSFAGQHFSAKLQQKWNAQNDIIPTIKKIHLTSSKHLTRDHFSWLCKWAMLQLQANHHLTFFSLNSGKAHRFHTDFR
jgi:hypothetical protein